MAPQELTREQLCEAVTMTMAHPSGKAIDARNAIKSHDAAQRAQLEAAKERGDKLQLELLNALQERDDWNKKHAVLCGVEWALRNDLLTSQQAIRTVKMERDKWKDAALDYLNVQQALQTAAQDKGALYEERNRLRLMLDRIAAIPAVAEGFHAPNEECIADGVESALDDLTDQLDATVQERDLLRSESIKITASLHDDEIPTTDPLSVNVEDVRILRDKLAASQRRAARVVKAAQELLAAWKAKTPLAWQPENNRALLDNLTAACQPDADGGG